MEFLVRCFEKTRREREREREIDRERGGYYKWCVHSRNDENNFIPDYFEFKSLKAIII